MKFKNNENTKFKIFTPISTKKSLELEEDGTLILQGRASDTSLDLQYDVVTESAIAEMKEQAPKLNIHADHDYTLTSVIGTIVEVLDSDDDVLDIKFKIVKDFAETIKNLLDAGVKLGLSIGGDVQEFKEIEDLGGFYGWEIISIKLYEISLVALPANWNTFGTVTSTKGVVKAKCLAGACYQILKNNGEIMKGKKKNVNKADGEEGEETPVTEASVEQMINEAIDEAKEDIKNQVKEEVKTELKDEILEEIAGEEEESSEGEEEKGLEESEEPLITDEDKKQLKDKIKEEARDELLKELGMTRNPTSKDLEELEEELEEEEEEEELPESQSVDGAVKSWTKSTSNNSLASMLQRAAKKRKS